MSTRAVASLWEWLIRGETAIPGGREVFKVLKGRRVTLQNKKRAADPC